jgi:excisionase family DNA binding protein
MEKYLMSIPEAAKYFNIGKSSFRRFVKEHEDAEWRLSIGNKVMIKREMLEEYLYSVKRI